jgi:Na+-transporting methylmalonyl-CoA/oxaloacetate decarboxylase beta subunit
MDNIIIGRADDIIIGHADGPSSIIVSSPLHWYDIAAVALAVIAVAVVIALVIIKLRRHK